MLRYLGCKIFRFLVKTITVTEGHHQILQKTDKDLANELGKHVK